MDLQKVMQTTKDLNILYIENDKEEQEHISALLNIIFLKVGTADDYQDGLKVYDDFLGENHQSYDLILTDISMSNTHGVEFCQSILEKNSNQHIIILSEHPTKDHLEKLITLGIDSFIQKPIHFNTFYEVLQKCSKPIFEQKEVTKELKKIERINNNLEVLLEVLNQVALVTKINTKGNITQINNLFIQTTQYQESEICGLAYKHIVHKDMPEIVFQNMQEELQQGKRWNGKLKCVTKNQEPFYVNADIFPMYNHKGNLEEYIAVGFLTTQEEMKHREFKKKVLMQYQESKRRDFNARNKINQLEAEVKKLEGLKANIKNCENHELLEYALQQERLKHAQCKKHLIIMEKQNAKLQMQLDKNIPFPQKGEGALLKK